MRPRGWFTLPVGVCRTPPVRGKGDAHLSRSCGADIKAIGNRDGLTLLQMAQGNPAMQEALRRHGAA